MTPRDALQSLAKRGPEPMYLFLGPDLYRRNEVRRALSEAVSGEVTRVSMEETTVAAVLDDASALSLFATSRLIWCASAEAALPRRVTAAKDDDDGPAGLLQAYSRNPTPGTVVVFDCSRYGYDGDDKAKLDRVRKYFSAVPAVVEFEPFDVVEAVKLGRELASAHRLKLADDQLALLVEATGADASRIGVEIEKLALYTAGRAVTMDDLIALVPNARQSNIFALVAALASGDRARSLDVLDVLVREGEYLPLVLTFLGTQFRLAMAASEAKATQAGQIQALFAKTGVPMWRSRAEQLAETLRIFPAAKLRKAILATYAADRALRDTRPDDRVMMERLVWELTA